MSGANVQSPGEDFPWSMVSSRFGKSLQIRHGSDNTEGRRINLGRERASVLQ